MISARTARLVVETIARYVPDSTQQEHLIEELAAIPGNESFAASIVTIREMMRARHAI